MSIPVDVDDLASALQDFGTGYLLTASIDGAVKVVAAAPRLEEGALLVREPGRGSLANLSGNPAVTMVFPPLEQPGHTLIVDGTATVDGRDVRVTPTGAVLHRPVS